MAKSKPDSVAEATSTRTVARKHKNMSYNDGIESVPFGKNYGGKAFDINSNIQRKARERAGGKGTSAVDPLGEYAAGVAGD